MSGKNPSQHPQPAGARQPSQAAAEPDGVAESGIAVSAAFVARFAIYFIAFEVAYNLWARDSRAFDVYLTWNARGAAVVLSSLWHPVEAIGRELHGPHTALSVESGCDALQPLALFASAVAAYPVAWCYRLVAFALGGVAILALNLARISTLYACLHETCGFFEQLHEAVWPTIFVLFVAIVWLAWARWVIGQSERREPQ